MALYTADTFGQKNQLAADKANDISAKAQYNQFLYNQQLQNAQIGAQIAMQNSANAFAASEAAKSRSDNWKMFGETQNYNAKQQAEAMVFNSAEAQKNREWQEYMASTAIQRQVADLKAAGINPILAAQYMGASVGSGSSASIGSGASVSPMSAQMASAHMGTASGSSVSSYSGQMANTSNFLAAVGSLYDCIDTLLTKMKDGSKKGSSGLNSFTDKILNSGFTAKIKGGMQSAKKVFDEAMESLGHGVRQVPWPR